MWYLRIINRSPESAIQNTIDEQVKLANEDWKLSYDGEHPKGGMALVTLRPYHVDNTAHTLPDAGGYETWNIVIATAYTWQNWISTTIDQKVYIVVTGIFNRTQNPSVTELKFTADNLTLAVQNCEMMYCWEEQVAFFSAPFGVKKEKAFTARCYGRRAQTEMLGLTGFAVVKTGVAVTES